MLVLRLWIHYYQMHIVNHVFVGCRAKVTKYGERVLETIEATIREYYKTEKNSGSSSNDSNESMKRRRDLGKVAQNSKDEDDFSEATGRSKKRTLTKKNTNVESVEKEDPYEEFFDVDIDFDDSNLEMETNGSNLKVDVNDGGRVLPSWSPKVYA